MAGTRLLNEKSGRKEMRRITKNELPEDSKVYAGIPALPQAVVATTTSQNQDALVAKLQQDKSKELELRQAAEHSFAAATEQLGIETQLKNKAQALSAELTAKIETLEKECTELKSRPDSHPAVPDKVWVVSVDRTKTLANEVRLLCKVSLNEDKSGDQIGMIIHIPLADAAKLQKQGGVPNDNE